MQVKTKKITIKKSTFQYVESELYDYHETRKEIVRLKNDILYGSAQPDNNGGGRSNLPGDPTGKMGILLVSHKKIENLERMVSAIESVYEALPEDKKKMVFLKYWARPQTLTWDGVALEVDAHRTTVMRWRDEIICAIAIKAGLR